VGVKHRRLSKASKDTALDGDIKLEASLVEQSNDGLLVRDDNVLYVESIISNVSTGFGTSGVHTISGTRGLELLGLTLFLALVRRGWVRLSEQWDYRYY
jgi:hypothetical protein